MIKRGQPKSVIGEKQLISTRRRGMDFSVSMAVYEKDDPEQLTQALDSVIHQGSSPAEIVLVVDGPVGEDLCQLIESKERKISKLKVHWLPNNLGHGEARRIGLEKCSHNIVAIMDSDDISASYRFEKQLNAFDADKNISIVGGQIAEFVDNKDNIVGKRIVPLSDRKIKKCAKSRCPMNQVTVMFKKIDIMNAGGYLHWHHNEDYYLWVRMISKGMKFHNIDETLVYVRINADSYERRGGINYFLSEVRLQRYMYKTGIINVQRYLANSAIRLCVQVLLPNRLRQIFFAKLARKSVTL